MDRSPWGPAAIAVAFALVGVVAVTRFTDAPGVWLVVLLSGLCTAWYVRSAVLRYLSEH